MTFFNKNAILILVFCLQGIVSVFANGGCGGCGEYNNNPIYSGDCGPTIAPSPPISLLPVPQPLPIRVPVPPKQSVTIPNIILALLPPTNKPTYVSKPVIKLPPSAPIAFPLPPQSYPSAIAPSPSIPPISFLPVPQPFPIRVPVPPKQSVTIPNIILALLPPTNKPPYVPKPVVKPPPSSPMAFPLPQPYPYPIPGCDSASYGCSPISYECGSVC